MPYLSGIFRYSQKGKFQGLASILFVEFLNPGAYYPQTAMYLLPATDGAKTLKYLRVVNNWFAPATFPYMLLSQHIPFTYFIQLSQFPYVEVKEVLQPRKVVSQFNLRFVFLTPAVNCQGSWGTYLFTYPAQVVATIWCIQVILPASSRVVDINAIKLFSYHQYSRGQHSQRSGRMLAMGFLCRNFFWFCLTQQ